MKKIKKHFLMIYVILNILSILLCGYLYVKQQLTLQKISRLYIAFLFINLTVIIFHIIKKINNKEKLRIDYYDIFLIFIFFFSVLSCIFALYKYVALFGIGGRYEGFFQIMYYFSLFLLSSFLNKDERKIVSYTILFFGAVETLYAMCQVCKIFNVFTQYHLGKPWATGFVTNPNFFGSLTILCLSISIGCFFDSTKRTSYLIFSAFILLFMNGVLISNTLSAVIGLIVVLMYCFFYALIKKKKIKFLVVVSLISLITGVQTITHNTYVIKDLIKTKNQSVEIAKGNIKDNYGSNRMYIWKHTLRVVPDHLAYGVGIDNFAYAFGGKPLSMKSWIFDKAHNEYLQILICEGIFALLAYLAFYGSITLKGIKYSIKNNELFLILPVIGYLVQAFFNISVIEVAPIFYIALGLCANRDNLE